MLLIAYFSACNMKKIQSAVFGVPEYDMNREGTYKPRISPEHLRKLWKRKQESGKPITELVADALDSYFNS
jgi:hypothetical protein